MYLRELQDGSVILAGGVGEEEDVVDGLDQLQLHNTPDDERVEQGLLRRPYWNGTET